MMSQPQGTSAYPGPGDTVVMGGPVTPKPTETKPGYKSSEAWLSATAISALTYFGEVAVWPIAAVAVGYALSRALTKFSQ